MKRSSFCLNSESKRRPNSSNPFCKCELVKAQQYDHPGSALAGPAPTFKSRYADPNHPANSGSPISLLTGGHFNPSSRRQGRRRGGLISSAISAYQNRTPSDQKVPQSEQYGAQGQRTGVEGEQYGTQTEYRAQGSSMSQPPMGSQGYSGGAYGEGAYGQGAQYGPGGRRPRGGLRSKMSENVAYLLIVNMPSEEELAAARERLAAEQAAKDAKKQNSFLGISKGSSHGSGHSPAHTP